MITAHVGYWQGGGRAGYFVEWYDEDNQRVARWYGTLEECNERAKEPPDDSWWASVSDQGSPPYDAATATGCYDD